MDVVGLGQVFTPAYVVSKMVGLIQNDGLCLEPSCGDGAFIKGLEQGDKCYIAVEYDTSVAHKNAVISDFFAWEWDRRISTVIGNPPYIGGKAIAFNTKALLGKELNGHANLYMWFMLRCVKELPDGGELIFIVPRDFMLSTSAVKLNELMYETGTFTHFEEQGDSTVFGSFAPNTVIFRWQKGLKTHCTDDGRGYVVKNGVLSFGEGRGVLLGSLFDIKVGAVSGNDGVFEHPSGSAYVCSSTQRDGKPRYLIDSKEGAEQWLSGCKEELLKRRIRSFDDSNWWQFGRICAVAGGERVYVNRRTRMVEEPFYMSKFDKWDGSVFALFPKSGSLEGVLDRLNAVDWSKTAHFCDGRLIFSQRSLEFCAIE